MKIENHWEIHYGFFGKVSDSNSQLAFAGLASLRIFRGRDQGILRISKKLVAGGPQLWRPSQNPCFNDGRVAAICDRGPPKADNEIDSICVASHSWRENP